MNNLLVFPSLHRLTPTGEHVGFITELDYFNKHKVKTSKAQSIAIQAYLSKVGRYSDKKGDDGNYINQVHAVDWSGMFFLDYDMQKEYKGTKKGEKAAQIVKKALIDATKLHPIIKAITTSASKCGLHIVLQFYKEALEFDEYSLFYKALIREIYTYFPEECKKYYSVDDSNSSYYQLFYKGYDPEIWLNPDWVATGYNNIFFAYNVRPIVAPLLKKYDLNRDDYDNEPIEPSPLLKNAKIISDPRRIPNGFHRKQITNALVHTFGFDLKRCLQFWSNKTTTDGTPVTESEVKESFNRAIHDKDYSSVGIRHLNRLGLLHEVIINEEAIEMHSKFLTDMNIQLIKGHNLIVSPCGSGKTQYAVTHKNAVIVEPLISILENNFRTAEEVAPSHRKIGSIDIMTYDQFVKHNDEFLNKDYIIFDECHCVDQMFRKKVFPSLIFLIDKFLEMGKTIISLTGTPNAVFANLWPDAKVFNFKREASPQYEFHFIPVLKKNQLFDTCFDILQRNKAENYASIVFNNNISMNNLLKEQLVAYNIDAHTLSAGDRSYLDKMNESKKLGCDCAITTSVMREGSEIKETPDIDNRMFNKEIKCVYIIDAVSTKPQDIIQSMNRVRNQKILYCDIIVNMTKGLKAKQARKRPNTQLTKHEKLSRMTANERADLLHDARTDYEINEIAFYEALCADEVYKYQEAKQLWIALTNYGLCTRSVSTAPESGVKIKKRDRTEEARKLIPFVEKQNEDTLKRWSLGLDLYKVDKDTKMLQFLARLHQNETIFNALKSGITSYSEVEDYMNKEKAIKKVIQSKLLYSMVDFCIRNPKKKECKVHPVSKWIKSEDLKLTGSTIDFIKGVYTILFDPNPWFNIIEELEGLDFDTTRSVCASLCNESFIEYLEEKERIINGRAERTRIRQKSYNKVHCYKVVKLSDKEYEKQVNTYKLLKKDKAPSHYIIKRTTKNLDDIDYKTCFTEKSDADKLAKELEKNLIN